ncbi:hypothetical protein [Blastopirellula sediminis]|nr:hypothetical protein [Blastopirellula sediminis]MCC9609060.1 hypothetical protein [Blastopirellula sediminis]
MKRFVASLALPLVGAGLVTAGFLYGLEFANIPYQDPTPELQANWEYHHSIAATTMKIGGGIFLLGSLGSSCLLMWVWLSQTSAIGAED